MADDAKTVVRRYFEAGNRDDLEAWDSLCDLEMVLYTGITPPIHGLSAVKQFSAGMHSAFSPFFLSVEDMVAEGDTVAVRWTTGGQHTSPLMSPSGPIPATNKRITMQGMSLMRVSNGKITEERTQGDMLSFLQQLGVIPEPQQTRG